jgi:hypothetical protein
MDRWLLNIDRWFFTMDRMLFNRDRWLFNRDRWLFNRNRWLLNMDRWLFNMDTWLFNMERWLLNMNRRFFILLFNLNLFISDRCFLGNSLIKDFNSLLNGLIKHGCIFNLSHWILGSCALLLNF